MTAEECAEQSGIAFSIFNQIKNGKLSPTLENIKNIAKTLDVTPAEIVPSFGGNIEPGESKTDEIYLCPDCGCRINSKTGKKI